VKIFLPAIALTALLAAAGCASLFEGEGVSPRGEEDIRREIDGLFATYREGVERGDYAEIASCFGSPIDGFVLARGRLRDAMVRLGEVAAARWGAGEDEQFRRFADLMGGYTSTTGMDYRILRVERTGGSVRVAEETADGRVEYTVEVSRNEDRWVMLGVSPRIAENEEALADGIRVDDAYIDALGELARLVIDHRIDYEKFYVAFFRLNDEYLMKRDRVLGVKGESSGGEAS
jgi:hypothetical protein